MKTVIMAGGRGTRISDLFPDIPKPLIPINGKPILQLEIESLKLQGFTDIILTVGYKADKIIDYFQDGSQFGVNIEYFIEETPLGNAGALFRIKDKLKGDFLLLNGDAMFNVDFNRFVKYHKEKDGLATLFTHPNSHPYDSGLIISDENHKVKQWLAKEDKRPENYKNRVNAGLHVLNSILLDQKINSQKIDLDRDILKPLALTGNLYCYDSPEYVKDMGTPERFNTVCLDYQSGVIDSKNLKNKQKAMFLDRDGTLNKYVGFLRDKNNLELLPKVVDAVKLINESGYLAIVITNQPVIARGEVSYSELEEIHNKLERLLGEEGAYLDDIYYCPHHPDSGFPGEIPNLKIECDCRKPNAGLLYKAAEEYNIDLSNSWMIGDSKIDVMAGKNAGCMTGYISPDKNQIISDINGSDLYSIVKEIIDANTRR